MLPVYHQSLLQMMEVHRLIQKGQNGVLNNPFNSSKYVRYQVQHQRLHTIGEQSNTNQTLIRPDATSRDVILNHASIPTVVFWSNNIAESSFIRPQADSSNIVNTEIQAPEFQAANQTPMSPQKPEQNENSRDYSLPHTSSSPVIISEANVGNMVLQTPTIPAPHSSSARVISISDLSISHGTIAVPAAHQVARTVEDSSRAISSPSLDANTAGDLMPVKHITQPTNGHFKTVVIGNSIDNNYAESDDIWSGRMVYSVYLNVGVAHNWILQYALPKNEYDIDSGSFSQISAPWPIEIYVPAITLKDVMTDAILVHGIVNTSGSFETLSIVYPNSFKFEKALLSSLQQWRFRPSVISKKETRVEILLTIPIEYQ